MNAVEEIRKLLEEGDVEPTAAQAARPARAHAS